MVCSRFHGHQPSELHLWRNFWSVAFQWSCHWLVILFLFATLASLANRLENEQQWHRIARTVTPCYFIPVTNLCNVIKCVWTSKNIKMINVVQIQRKQISSRAQPFLLRASSLSSVYSELRVGGDQKWACLPRKCRTKAGRFPQFQLGMLVSAESGTHY